MFLACNSFSRSDIKAHYLIFFLTDFPESEKLTLFIANMWHDVFVSQSVINKAMQLVARQRARGEVLSCLRAFLSWEKVRAAGDRRACSCVRDRRFADDVLCMRFFKIPS